MTRQKALNAAKAILGPNAAVEMRPNGARIGVHGEFLSAHAVNNTKGSPKQGRYRCDRCSTTEAVDEDFIVREVWHTAGGWQTSYRIGRIDLGMFFMLRAEADSFEACLEKLKPVAKIAATS
jgi:hypothetical protein